MTVTDELVVTRKYWGERTHVYAVTGLGDHAMTDKELINHCDGGDSNFGGHVTRHRNGEATVTVYID